MDYLTSAAEQNNSSEKMKSPVKEVAAETNSLGVKLTSQSFATMKTILDPKIKKYR